MRARYMLLKGLGEDRIIEGLKKRSGKRHPRLVMGIGDDTSVTRQKAGLVTLATVDTLIEGTHFDPKYTAAYLLGRKSLSISVSDIAAMGGRPLFFLVSLMLPEKTEKRFLDEIYRGINDAAEEYGAVIAGGNIARSVLTAVTTTVFGEAKEKEVIYRSGASEGDIIYVTGTPGDSALGLKVLRNHGARALKGRFRKAALKHLDPRARIEAGRALARRRLASAMIDISDGVALDLTRICRSSGKGAIIELEDFPISDEMNRYREAAKNSSWIDLALSGGEDYELLFTSPEPNRNKIASLAKSLGLRITAIGRMTNGRGIKVLGKDKRPYRLKRAGFEHF